MIILPEQNAVYVGIHRTGSKSMHWWLERAFRDGGSPYAVESLHDWHASLKEAADACDYPLFRMWSFAVVRNPFDRLVSWAAMSDPYFSERPQESLRMLLESEPTRWTMPQVHFTEGVKHVYQFEQLSVAIADLRERLSIPDSVEFPHEHKTDREHYRAYFTKELRGVAELRYADDLAAFGYSF